MSKDSVQISREHQLLLRRYIEAADKLAREAQREQQRAQEALNSALRFSPSHSIQDLATTILDTATQVKIFNCFIWEEVK